VTGNLNSKEEMRTMLEGDEDYCPGLGKKKRIPVRRVKRVRSREISGERDLFASAGRHAYKGSTICKKGRQGEGL